MREPLDTHPILDELLAGGVIDPAQFQAALAKMSLRGHDSEPFHTLGEGLLWLLKAELFTDDDLTVLEQRSEAEANFATNVTRKRTIEEFLAVTQALAAGRHIEFKRKFWAELLPGPRWAWVLGAPCALLFAGWYFYTSRQTPTCGDADVKRTIVVALFEAQNKQFPFANRSEKQPNLLGAQLKDAKELGYIKAERSRGCSATLKVDDLQLPVAYTVAPAENGKGFRVAGGDPRVIGAKYGHADDETLPEAGQPIGATALRAAFTEAVAALEKKASPGSSLDAARRARLKSQGRESESDLPTVRSVIPLGPCTPAAAGRYTCRLQVQYSDRLMSALSGGAGLEVFDGDFEFEQQAGQWRVAPGFDQKFVEAKVRARIADLNGEEAAHALEKIQRERKPASAPSSPATN